MDDVKEVRREVYCLVAVKCGWFGFRKLLQKALVPANVFIPQITLADLQTDRQQTDRDSSEPAKQLRLNFSLKPTTLAASYSNVSLL